MLKNALFFEKSWKIAAASGAPPPIPRWPPAAEGGAPRPPSYSSHSTYIPVLLLRTAQISQHR